MYSNQNQEHSTDQNDKFETLLQLFIFRKKKCSSQWLRGCRRVCKMQEATLK